MRKKDGQAKREAVYKSVITENNKEYVNKIKCKTPMLTKGSEIIRKKPKK